MIRKLTEKELVIASHNTGKIKEITALLSPHHLHIQNAAELHLPEPEENGATYLENALIKARACVERTGLPSLADDSGIEVTALQGAPGLHTAPYTEEHGGRERVFAMWAANEKIAKDPEAYFICVLVLAWPDGHYEHTRAEIKGRLTFPPRGQNGHGYDPVFIPDGFNQTVAEMELNDKNIHSHRFLALAKLIDRCL